MKHLAFSDLDGETQELLRRFQSKNLAAKAFVRFTNADFWSSQFGATSWLAVGPGCTVATVEACEGQWLNDLPSQRQYADGWLATSEVSS